MAEPTPKKLPALIHQKTALHSPHIADPQTTAKKRASRKRNRKIASCTNCRSRKVGCDKGHPCSRCKTKGLECVYIENPADLDKAPTRVVRKRNRRVKVCLNCRQRKIPCDQRKPCRSCEGGSISCTYQPSSEVNVSQHEEEQTSPGSGSNDNDLQQGVEEETEPADRDLSSALVFGRQSGEATYGRQDEQSGVPGYSATSFYGYATTQNQAPDRHQYTHDSLYRLPEPRHPYQQRTAYRQQGGEPQVRHSGRNDQGEGSVRGTRGATAYRSQPYLPPLGEGFHIPQRAPYNYSPLPPSPYAAVLPQPIRNHPQPLYPPRQLLVDPTIQHQNPPNIASGPREVYQQPKPDVNKLETETKDSNSNEDRPRSLNSPSVGAINGPPFQPNAVPWYRRLGAGLTLKKF